MALAPQITLENSSFPLPAKLTDNERPVPGNSFATSVRGLKNRNQAGFVDFALYLVANSVKAVREASTVFASGISRDQTMITDLGVATTGTLPTDSNEHQAEDAANLKLVDQPTTPAVTQALTLDIPSSLQTEKSTDTDKLAEIQSFSPILIEPPHTGGAPIAKRCLLSRPAVGAAGGLPEVCPEVFITPLNHKATQVALACPVEGCAAFNSSDNVSAMAAVTRPQPGRPLVRSVSDDSLTAATPAEASSRDTTTAKLRRRRRSHVESNRGHADLVTYIGERLVRSPSLEDVCGADDDSKPLTTDYANARPFMKNNPYITHGYRTFKSKERCIRGIFRWNNETLNIWTNFIALGGLVGLFATDLLFNYRLTGFNTFDRALSAAMTLGYLAMLLFSSVYHIFNCCCYRCHRYWYFWDFVGIVASVYAYGVGFLFLQFRAQPAWIAFYAGVMSPLALLPIGLTVASDRFAHERYDDSRSIWVGGFVVFSCVPIAHYVVVHGGFASPVVQLTLPLHLVVIGLLLASYTIYETKIPERLFPGKVNYIGSSHQLWHCGVGISVFIARRLYFRYIEAFNIINLPLKEIETIPNPE